jgi:HK97 family phage prohead protease
VQGHASVYFDAADPGTRYMLWEDVEERVMPGAFDRALRENQDVRALFNHDSNQVIGRTSSGTLKLSTDDKGLRYEANAPDTQVGRDVVTLIKRGDVTGSSFGFSVRGERIRKETRDGKPYYIRELTDVDLYDVSPTTFPAYQSSDASARAEIVSRAVSSDPSAEAARIRAAATPEQWEVDAQARARQIRLWEIR